MDNKYPDLLLNINNISELKFKIRIKDRAKDDS